MIDDGWWIFVRSFVSPTLSLPTLSLPPPVPLNSVKNARAAEHNGGDGKQFVAGARIRFGLSQSRRVNHRRQSGSDSCEDIDHGDPALDRQPTVACTFWRKTNRPPRTAENHTMHQQPDANRDRQKDRRLRGHPK